MKLYCLKRKKSTKIVNLELSETNNGKKMLLLKCAICNSKISRFIKNQEAKGLLSNFFLKTPLSKVPSLGNVLFKIIK